MKKSSILKYACLSAISFLSFLGITNAATPLAPGSSVNIPGGTKTNFTCDTGTISGFSVVKNGTDYTVTYDGSAGAGQTNKITCTYDGFIGIGDVTEKQTETYTFTTTDSVSNNINVNPETGETVIPPIMSNIVIDSVEANNEYIDLSNCKVGTDTCTVKASPEAANAAQNHNQNITGTVIVKYKILGTDPVQIITREISVNISTRKESIAKAYPGGVGVCHFDSNWEAAPWEDSGGTQFNAMRAFEGATLPNCEVQNSVIPVTFKGWVKAPNSNNSVLHAVGECSGALSPGTSVSGGGSYTNYYACYEADPFVQLAVEEGNISDLDNWEYQSGRGYVYINKTHATSATLPEVNLVGSHNANRKFEGWYNRATGQTLQAGASVELNGDVWEAQYSRTVVERDYHAAVYVDSVSAKKPGETVTGCSSNSDKVKAELLGGECQVTGLEPTGEGEYADVVVEFDGMTITYKYVVYPKDSQNGGEDFVIDTSENVIYDMEVINEAHEQIEILGGGFGVKTCSAYRVSRDGTYYWGESEKTSGRIRYHVGGASVYKVTPGGDCSNTASFYALCLDPGRPGPQSYNIGQVDYKTTTELSKELDLYKLVNYMYESSDFDMNRFGEVNYEGRIAAQILVRIVGIGDNFSAVDTTWGRNSDLVRHYNTFNNAYNKWISDGPDAAVAELGLNNPEHSSTPDFVKNIGSLVSKALSEYKSTDVADGEGSTSLGLEKEVENVDAEAINGGSGYLIKYTGTISLPNTVDNPQLTACGSNSFNVTCNVESWSKNGTSSIDSGLEVWNYVVSYTINDAKSFKVPETNEEKYELSFSLTYGGESMVGNVYILSQYAHNHDMQRMLAFDIEGRNSDLKVYWDIIPKPNVGNVCETVVAMNPNDPGFNEELFKASGCCDFIDDYGFDDETKDRILNEICSSDCAVSTLPQVCRINDGADPESADLYVIREGSKRTSSDDKDPQIKDQIGMCIVNTSQPYYNQNRTTSINASFLKNDDIGNKINVDNYKQNKYCQVTCKEDWAISMDSFGNYVGVNAVAAGSYFSILNDIFIGGKRTCYTTYLDYDKYMNDLEKLSKDVVDQYNIYSTNSHQYTNIDNRSESDITIEKSEKKCAIWKDAPTGFSDTDYDSSTGNFVQKHTVESDGYENCSSPDTLNSSAGKCEHDKPASGTCETGYTASGSKCQKDATPKYKCPDKSSTLKKYDGTGVDGVKPDNATATSECTYTVALECKSEGYAFNYGLKTSSSDVENGKYVKYNTAPNAAKKVTTVFNEALDTERNITSNPQESYYRKDLIECTIDENKGPGKKANVSCDFKNDEKNGTEPANISGNAKGKAICSTYHSENDNICADSTTAYSKSDAFDLLETKVKTATEEKANSAKAIAEAKYVEFYRNVEDFYDCQHFELYNTSDDENGKANNTLQSENVLGPTREFIKIQTAFDPKVSYTYDEPAFMTILGKDNILIENEEKNNSIISNYKDVTNQKAEAQIQFVDDEKKLGYYDEKVNLSRNYLEYKYYNPTTLWTKTGTPEAFEQYKDDTEVKSENKALSTDDANSSESKYVVLCTIGSDHMNYHHEDQDNKSDRYKFTGSVSGTTWNEGSCYKVKVTYKKSRYISSSIENSSFYKNKGSWFVRGGDIKEHGDDLKNAISNANARGASYTTSLEELRLWSPIGAEKDGYVSYNTFPISLNAPRNLYQYTYWFADIGSFSDGKLGRIMGNTEGGKSIIKLNNRTCFYEVYEEVCLCCGSEINSYTEGSITITENFLDENGSYNYDLVQDEDFNGTNQGRLNINTSTVSLNDINSQYGSGSRKLPSNWSSDSPFFYAGKTYLTNKGEVAKKEIEALGENAYAAKAEYSYHLTPSTMIAIKEYNNGVGYDINFSRLKVYGRVPIKSISGTDGWDATDDELNDKYPNFQHYGSKFLEDYMTDLNAVYGDTITKLKDYKTSVCYATDESDLKNKIQSGNCRWIDYVQTIDGNTFRLAFK